MFPFYHLYFSQKRHHFIRNYFKKCFLALPSGANRSMYQPGDGQRAPYFGNYPRHYIVNGDGSGKSTAITSLGGSPSVGLGGRKQQNETVEGGLFSF